MVSTRSYHRNNNLAFYILLYVELEYTRIVRIKLSRLAGSVCADNTVIIIASYNE